MVQVVMTSTINIYFYNHRIKTRSYFMWVSVTVMLQ